MLKTILLFLMATILFSCDVFESDAPNTPPEIEPINGQMIQVNPDTPVIHVWVTLAVNATDPEGEELRFFWEVKVEENALAVEPLSAIEAQIQATESTQRRLSNRVKFLPTQVGSYHVAVSIVDSRGETVTVTKTIAVRESVETLSLEFREPPIILIGKQPLPVGEQAVLVANPVTLDPKLTYAWSVKDSRGQASIGVFTPDSASPEKGVFQSGEEDNFTVILKMSDDSERAPAESSLVITVTRENRAPVFDAQPFTLNPPISAEQPFLLVNETVEITANATDADEKDQPKLQFTWRALLNNQEVTDRTLRSSLSAVNRVFFQIDTGGVYTVETTVSDGRGGTDKTFLQLRVNTSPRFQQGILIKGALSVNTDIELRARAEDVDNDRLSYSWAAIFNNADVTAGVFGGKTTGDVILFRTPDAGIYQVTVTATDGKRGAATNTVFIDIKAP